ncbi:uncharacterized protein LOC108202228 isoform X2 [Daucus carota subsp. sativus]|uniref:uncharacterized protein LOC108202228 isoform X2 n=1 Tax=Daucus carota subsp. sativus TaxID=79200 RepID=UPI0007EFEA96|nr:PREDICTED: uncharacterized protein LOC108202228 isoform X2 [Daucus carota subsp. sativus]
MNSDDSSSQQFSSKKGRLLQEDINSCRSNSPLGLRLDKTQSFISLVESKLSKTRKSMDSEKLKASNMSATFVKIGNWEMSARHEGHIVAKCYYAKKKIVWEILEGALKRKIEIHWADIIGINAMIKDGECGILLIELGHPPAYYREFDPMPRKHTVWQQASDFTGGQAPLHRRHLLIFPPGVLDRHYEKLLQFDKRLFELSQKPFPTQNNQYFHSNILGYTPYPSSSILTLNRQSDLTKFQTRCHDQIYEQTSGFGIVDTSSPTSERNSLLKNQGTVYSTPGQSSNTMDLQYSGYTYQDCQHRAYREDLGMAFGIGGIQITEIEQHLLGDSEVVGTDDAALLARVSSLHSFFDLDEGNLTKESSIVASPMIIEDGYFGYRSGASVDLQSYNGTIPLYPSTGPSASVDLLPVHDCENLSLDPFRGMCHWS